MKEEIITILLAVGIGAGAAIFWTMGLETGVIFYIVYILTLLLFNQSQQQ